MLKMNAQLMQTSRIKYTYKKIHLTLNSSILMQMYKFHGVVKLLHTLLLLITVVIRSMR